MLAVCEPLVPVTIRVAVVGGFTTGGGGVLLAEPPQAVRPPMTNRAINASTACLRFFRRLEASPMNTPPNTNSIVLRNGTGMDRAFCVPETVTVIGTLEDEASRLTEVGFTEQVVPAGAPEQLSATVPMKPCDPIEMLYVAVCPDWTVAEVLPPVPEKLNCGVPALTTTVTEAAVADV